MSSNPFLQFINLVKIDQKIESLEKKQQSFDSFVSAIKKQKDKYNEEVEHAQQKVVQLKKNVDAQELEMQTLDAKEHQKKNLLNSLSDYKECQAIKNEVELIQRLQVTQEQLVLNAWINLESAQLALEKKRIEIADLFKKDDDALHLVEQDKNLIMVELNQLITQRVAQTVGIPEEWLEKYELMAQRVDNPVVPIEQNSCGGCYQQLTQQDLVRARHGALMQCKKCFRLMYFPEIMHS